MSYQISYSLQDDLLHITVSGTLSTPDTVPVWREILELSQQRQPERILLECILHTDQLSMHHCFELIDHLPMLSRLLHCKIALCEKNAGDEARRLFQFIETAAQDRGAQFRFFDTTENARRWLNSTEQWSDPLSSTEQWSEPLNKPQQAVQSE
jgi:hypothetical protein